MKTHFDEQLTPHFSLREMTNSGTAVRLGIDNTPDDTQKEALRQLCTHVLEPLRLRFGRIIVSSGFRSAVLNRAVGGKADSQHLRGEAADIHCASREQAALYYEYIRRELDFDQLLQERRLGNGCCWLHVSYISQPGRRANRRQAMTLAV